MENDDFARYWTQEGTMLETIPSYLMFLKMAEDGYKSKLNMWQWHKQEKRIHEQQIPKRASFFSQISFFLVSVV